ncbi:hypothetical protein, partial [Thermoleptolyngbya sp.]
MTETSKNRASAIGGESPTYPKADRARALRANGEDKRRSPALGLNQNLCSVRFIEVLALGDRPSSPRTDISRRSPPDTSRNL